MNNCFLAFLRLEDESEIQCAQLISRSMIIIYTVYSDDWFEYIFNNYSIIKTSYYNNYLYSNPSSLRTV